MPMPVRVAATPRRRKVVATPSSRDTLGAPLGWLAVSGDEASPSPSATWASQPPNRRFRASSANGSFSIRH